MFTTSDIEKYFNGEKQESLLFIAIGIAGIVWSVSLCNAAIRRTECDSRDRTAFAAGSAAPAASREANKANQA